jgi:GNAT superfamily N-acetyltransferase
MRVRRGGPADVPAVVGLFDEAVEWLVARGSVGQWGSEPFSAFPERVAREERRAADGLLRVAEEDGAVVGALGLAQEPPSYVEPVAEREVYVRLLLTSRRRAGTGVGAALLASAREEALARGVRLLRVDCWDGGDGKLAAYYRGQGFTPSHGFVVAGQEWKGLVLSQRLPAGE